MSTARAQRPRPAAPSFGPTLRQWRDHRGLSQLELGLRSGVSQRHISFLESGRARPSRDMVLHLSETLDVPLRHRNVMLTAAGFAAAYRETELESPELAAVSQALDFLLEKQEPYPAIVVDRLWNVQRGNKAALNFMAYLLGQPLPGLPRLNLLEAILAPGPLREAIENWEDAAGYLVRRLNQELLTDGDPGQGKAMLARITALPGVPDLLRAATGEESFAPVLTTRYRKGDERLVLFTMLTTLGTPQDVTLQEMRIESFFPADARSRQILERLSADA
ncbi:helix-turn-helix domain-containing protein [Zavarzinia sp. CC-PAN008]|uniref:helix-turn-helix domain-containing protein n=1 Tax=Zavarzinia sp. CC-PAN008 TaxID=3243332 RepID=UPI003F749D48